MSQEPLEVNRRAWDERAPAHAASPDYAVSRFAEDPSFISDVVRYDVPRLGDLTGQRGVHLQCHIGTDTISLARLGATMTGLDFSAASIEHARRIASLARQAEIEFVQSDVYGAPGVLGTGGFDLVFTGIGALCWLPSIERWAQVVAALLKPGGRLHIREGHPMLWALEEHDGRFEVDYTYFERAEPTAFETEGTYVETDHAFVHNASREWNHGLGEIVSALLAVGMRITRLEEHDSIPWVAFPGHMEPIGGGEFRITERPWRIPHSYTLQAVKQP